MESSIIEKYFDVNISVYLLFDNHITDLCCRTSRKIHPLSRVVSDIRFDKKVTLLNTFITSQFSYHPLKWMCHNKSLNNIMDHVHERALKIVYQDKKSNFKLWLKMKSLLLLMWKSCISRDQYIQSQK